tara:strand:- start:449 stop:700 length:252 start_codon:yes stop_codon:yes gene_type:complete
MKVGDLVTLSAAGEKSQVNYNVSTRCIFGIIVSETTNFSKPLYEVKWFSDPSREIPWVSLNFDGTQNHYRYEIKKFKKSNKKA